MIALWRRRPTGDPAALVGVADECLRAIGDAVAGYGTEAERLGFVAATVARWERTREGAAPGALPSPQYPYREVA
jgi:hypothetical protein